MKVEDLAQYILWGVSVIAFVGTAAMYLRGSADKGTITSLENSVAAFKIELELKDKKIQALEDKNTQQQQQIHSLGRELRTLNSVVTQANEIAHLQSTLEGHHNDAMTGVTGLRSQLSELHTLVQAIKSGDS